jgi:DNA-binding MarR family transcriptional regulator
VVRRPSAEAVASDGTAARLRLAVTRLSKRLRPTAAAGALTPTEVDVLFAADRRGPLRLSDLAGFAGLNPTMLSRLVPRLEAGGLLRRLVVEGDRRVGRVDVTPKGRRLLDRIRSERNDALSQLLRGLDDPERQAVLDALPVIEELAERLLARSPAVAASGRG